MESAVRTEASPERRTEPARTPTQHSTLNTQNYLLLPALLTAGLLFACYFPLDCGWLAWVALVPLLALVRSGASKKRIFFCAWAGGTAFFVPVLQWMRVADPAMYATWAALAIYCSLYFPVGILLIRRLDRTTRLPLVLTVPVVWAALEFLRSHLATGFSWYLLGHTQHDFLPAIQVTDLGGAYAVTLLVAAVNALLFEVLYARPWFRTFFALPEPARPASRRALLFQGAGVALLLGGSLAYGEWRLHQNDFAPGPKVALTQSNLDLRMKIDVWGTGPDAARAGESMQDHQARLTDIAVRHRPDLIVWPETSWPQDWVERRDASGTLHPNSQKLLDALAREWHTDILLGQTTLLCDGPDFVVRNRLNSAVLATADGRFGGRYDKIHCVPFGEYVPLRNWLPFMNWFSPYDYDYSITPGERLTRFPLGRYHFGVLICYEDTVTYLAREYALPDGDQPAADFLLNTTNDGWFDGTPEHPQHLAVARFRAVEARRSLGRAVNMGVSAVIDPNGRVLAPQETAVEDGIHVWEVPAGAGDLPPGRWGEFKKVPGVLIASIPIDHRVSLYSRLGDWLAWGCWLVVAAGLVLGYLRGRSLTATAATPPS
jgi:apolipoprotein N-acyltransferase